MRDAKQPKLNITFMNYGETLAYWYLRLNGFFLLNNFVVHRTPGNQKAPWKNQRA